MLQLTITAHTINITSLQIKISSSKPPFAEKVIYLETDLFYLVECLISLFSFCIEKRSFVLLKNCEKKDNRHNHADFRKKCTIREKER